MNNCCEKCSIYNLKFERNYNPEEFLVGKKDSPIWIIGLNPKGENDKRDKRESCDLENYFEERKNMHSYFNDFRNVSELLYNNLGKNKGVAHTDLVKCFSEKFPPRNNINESINIIKNCSDYLRNQIKMYKPKMIICNGSYVNQYIKDLIIPNIKKKFETYYIGNLDENEIIVVLSGFIGRIDNMAKRRLGKEIESLIIKYNIAPELHPIQ